MKEEYPYVCLVVKIATEEQWEFFSAHDAAMFMWGRDFEEYAIYRRFVWTDGDLRAFEKALEAIS